MFIGAVVFLWGYFSVNEDKFDLCNYNEYCIFSYNAYVDPLMFLSLFTLAISFFLFFISDKIFIKWLKFAASWMGITALFVLLAPVYTGGWMSFGPTKESVSIWMGSLFVILSLIKITWDWKKDKNGRN